MKKHMALKDSPVTVISAFEDWPKKYLMDKGNGLVSCPDALVQLKRECGNAFKELDTFVDEMCMENPAPSSKDFDKEYRKFITKQQEIFHKVQMFDNEQKWFPEEAIVAGDMDLTDTTILRSGFVKSSFLTSAGDKYLIEYSGMAPVKDIVKMDDKQGASKSDRQDEEGLLDAKPKIKEGHQKAAKVEAGVSRSRILYFDPYCSQGPEAAQTNTGGCTPYPDPATVFGPKYGECKDVEVTVGRDKFDQDSQGPATSCCFGKRKLHYRYVFKSDKKGSQPETLYLYRDL